MWRLCFVHEIVYFRKKNSIVPNVELTKDVINDENGTSEYENIGKLTIFDIFTIFYLHIMV